MQGTTKKERDFRCLVVRLKTNLVNSPGHGPWRVLVYSYYPGIIKAPFSQVLVDSYYPGIIKAPFSQSAPDWTISHWIIQAIEGAESGVLTSHLFYRPNVPALLYAALWAWLLSSHSTSPGTKEVLSLCSYSDQERGSPGRITHLIYQAWSQVMQLFPGPTICLQRYDCDLPRCLKVTADLVPGDSAQISSGEMKTRRKETAGMTTKTSPMILVILDCIYKYNCHP